MGSALSLHNAALAGKSGEVHGISCCYSIHILPISLTTICWFGRGRSTFFIYPRSYEGIARVILSISQDTMFVCSTGYTTAAQRGGCKPMWFWRKQRPACSSSPHSWSGLFLTDILVLDGNELFLKFYYVIESCLSLALSLSLLLLYLLYYSFVNRMSLWRLFPNSCWQVAYPSCWQVAYPSHNIFPGQERFELESAGNRFYSTSGGVVGESSQ